MNTVVPLLFSAAEASAKKASKRQSTGSKQSKQSGSIPHELGLAVEAQHSGASPLSAATRRCVHESMGRGVDAGVGVKVGLCVGWSV
jgi:hypothetical protein